MKKLWFCLFFLLLYINYVYLKNYENLDKCEDFNFTIYYVNREHLTQQLHSSFYDFNKDENIFNSTLLYSNNLKLIKLNEVNSTNNVSLNESLKNEQVTLNQTKNITDLFGELNTTYLIELVLKPNKTTNKNVTNLSVNELNKVSKVNISFDEENCGRSFDIDYFENDFDGMKFYSTDSDLNTSLVHNASLNKLNSSAENSLNQTEKIIDFFSKDLDNFETNIMKFDKNSHNLSELITLNAMLKNREEFQYVSENRIINGQRANPGQFPWQVSIQAWGRNSRRNRTLIWHHICGGSIINSLWIITAGHCLEFRRIQLSLRPKARPKLSVVIGSLSWNNNERVGQRFMVNDVRKYYDQFHSFGVYLQLLFDIALIKLDKPIKFTQGKNGVGAVEPICLPKLNNQQINDELRVSGWGSVTHYPFITIPLHLRTIDLPYVPDKECEARYWPIRNRKQFICAGYLDDLSLRGVCMGDSGSPLIQRGSNGRAIQVGVVSGGRIPCGSGAFPGTFSRISYYRSWIKAISGT